MGEEEKGLLFHDGIGGSGLIRKEITSAVLFVVYFCRPETAFADLLIFKFMLYYASSLTEYKRLPTKEVKIGDLLIICTYLI